MEKAGFAHRGETNTVKGAEITELWKHVATDDEIGGASVEEFVSADSAASFCEEISDRAIVATDWRSQQPHNDEIENGPYIGESALLSIESLIDFMYAKLQLLVFTQQLDTMHTTFVNPKLPQQQVQISDYSSAPNA